MLGFLDYKRFISEAIVELKRRKVRPCLERIIWCVKRYNFDVTEKTIGLVLDKLVESDDVIRVHYKGATSYRLASLVSESKRYSKKFNGHIMNSNATSNIIKKAILSGGKNGVTRKQLKEQLIKDGHSKLAYDIDAILWREVCVQSVTKINTKIGDTKVVLFMVNDDKLSSLPSSPSSISSSATSAEAQYDDIGADTMENDCKNVKVKLIENEIKYKSAKGLIHKKSTKMTKFDKNNLKRTATWPLYSDSECAISSVGTLNGDDRPRDGAGAGGGIKSIVRSVSEFPFTTPVQHNALVVSDQAFDEDFDYFDENMDSDDLNGIGKRAKYQYKRLMEEAGEYASTKSRGRPRRFQDNSSGISRFSPKRGRQLSQRSKRPKKVYDPSEGVAVGQILSRKSSYQSNNSSSVSPPTVSSISSLTNTTMSPAITSTTPLMSTSTPTINPSKMYKCDVCCQTRLIVLPGDDLLKCHNCGAKAHPSCLGYSQELAIKSRLGPWTCMDCKHCAVCNMDHNIGTLIFCDECDRAYHLTCHHPPLDEQPQGSWICCNCTPNNGHNAYDGLPTPRESPIPDEESRGSSGSWDTSSCDPEIPNVTHWSVDQIVELFNSKGFSEYTSVFQDQDIDGSALLMLSRSDVLTSLNLKLGPALKIYKQVRILQTRIPNPPLTY